MEGAARVCHKGSQRCVAPLPLPSLYRWQGVRPKASLGPAAGVPWPPSQPPRVRVLAGPPYGPLWPAWAFDALVVRLAHEASPPPLYPMWAPYSYGPHF